LDVNCRGFQKTRWRKVRVLGFICGRKKSGTLAASLLTSVQKMAAFNFNYSVDLVEERWRNVRFNYGFGSDVFPRAYVLGSIRK
jgi:hypothetical protein